MLRVGDFELSSVVTGRFRLDGGAMFGVVPKVLWEKTCDVDEQNRIFLAMRTLLAINRNAGRVVLVDTGCGPKWDPQKAARFAIEPDPTAVVDALHAAGLSTESVTDVIATHLHFDHNGGLTQWVDDPGEETKLCFPNARHWVHRRHWEHAHHPTVRDRASFLPEDFSALSGARNVTLVNGEDPTPPFDGVRWVLSHGHTPYQLHPLFEDERCSLLFVGDVVPTVAHLRVPWVMAYDLYPLTTIEEKARIYRQCLDEGLLLAFPHDPAIAGVAIDGQPDRPIVARTLPL